jgi:hypothetical protein
MDIKESIIIIQDYANQYGIGDFLKALEEMHLCFDDLNDKQARAYRTFTYFGREFFAEVE